jgi:hypothetical protein
MRGRGTNDKEAAENKHNAPENKNGKPNKPTTTHEQHKIPTYT